jgi:hypothetical protein
MWRTLYRGSNVHGCRQCTGPWPSKSQYYLALLLAPLLIARSKIRIYAFLCGTAAASLVSDDTRLLGPFLPFLRPWLCEISVFQQPHLDWGEGLLGRSVFRLVLLCSFGLLFVPLRGPVPILSFGGYFVFCNLTHIPIGGRVINHASRLPIFMGGPPNWLRVCAFDFRRLRVSFLAAD